jgi:hypothetical protein
VPITLRRIVLCMLFLCALALVVVSTADAFVDSPYASAQQPQRMLNKKQAKLCAQAKPVRKAVIKKFDKREPGRDICRNGNRNGSMPSVRKLAGYLATLKRKLAPPVVSTEQSASGSSSDGTVTGGSLSVIAQCESGSDPTVVDASGKYRGKYQFDQQTWESVGGSGDPAAAPEAEQDARAQALIAQRGSSPWPNCGN